MVKGAVHKREQARSGFRIRVQGSGFRVWFRV